MSEKKIDLDKETLFINSKTGEMAIGEIVDAEIVLEGWRGVPCEVSLDVTWKIGSMDTSYDSHIQKIPLRRLKEPSTQAHKAVKKRGWFFWKKKK